MASVVLPAPFTPTIASDDPAGIVRSKRSSTGGRSGRYANVTSRKRISRAGRPVAGSGVAADRERAGRRPSRGSSRFSATTGAAAPSSAQLQPPNAIIDVPTSAVRNTIVRSRRDAAVGGGVGDRPHDEHVRGEHEHEAQRERALAQPRRLATAARRGCGAGSVNRSMTQSASPNSRTSLAAGASTASRYAYSAWRCAVRTSSVLRSLPHRALAQQIVRREPRADEQRRRPPREAEQQQRPTRSRRPSRRGRSR